VYIQVVSGVGMDKHVQVPLLLEHLRWWDAVIHPPGRGQIISESDSRMDSMLCMTMGQMIAH